MWLPDQAKLVKVLLHAQGLDPETSWAEDCGPAPGTADSRFVRLGNVPFLHAKPTYGDVIVVSPNEDRMLSWDSEGLPFERIGERIIEDGGRWVMIVDYELVAPAGDPQRAFAALDRAGEEADIAVEGCFGPRAGSPGRAYLAVHATRRVDEVLAYLASRDLPLRLTLLHPRDDDE